MNVRSHTHPTEKKGGLTFPSIILQSINAVCLGLSDNTHTQFKSSVINVFYTICLLIPCDLIYSGLTVAKCNSSSPNSFFILRRRLTTARQGPHHCWYTSTTRIRQSVCETERQGTRTLLVVTELNTGGQQPIRNHSCSSSFTHYYCY